MPSLTFTVHGIPIAQPRHRVGTGSTRGLPLGQRARPRAYLPKDHPIHAFKEAVALACRQRMAEQAWGPPTTAAVRMEVMFVLPRPQSLGRKQPGRCPATHKPDLSNLLKGCEDALIGIALLDDSQIVRLVAEKWVAAPWEGPHVTVTLTVLEEMPT